MQTIQCGSSPSGHHDIMSIPAVEQRYGVAGSLRPPVRATVNCTWEEAVDMLREIFKLSLKEKYQWEMSLFCAY